MTGRWHCQKCKWSIVHYFLSEWDAAQEGRGIREAWVNQCVHVCWPPAACPLDCDSQLKLGLDSVCLAKAINPNLSDWQCRPQWQSCPTKATKSHWKSCRSWGEWERDSYRDHARMWRGYEDNYKSFKQLVVMQLYWKVIRYLSGVHQKKSEAGKVSL